MKGKVKGVFHRGGVAYIRYKDEHGNDVRESTYQRSFRVAEQILAKRKSELAMRKHFPTRRFNKVFFRELEGYWWQMHGRFTRSRLEYLVPRVDQEFGSKRAREIHPDDIQEFMLDLEAQGLSASSINHHRSILSGIFNFAIKRGRYDHNPVQAVPQMKEPPGRDRVPTPEEIRKLLDACNYGDEEVYVFIIMAGTTTMRKGEILQRRWDEIHLDTRIPYIYIPQTKNGDPKTVPIPEIVVEAVKRLPSYGKIEYLFPSRPTARFPSPERLYMWDIGKRFREVCRRVGVEGLRIHDLRHAGPSILLARGVPDGIVRKLTGHRSRELERYQHLSDELKRNTVELIAEELFGAPSGTVQREQNKQRMAKL